MSRMTLYQTLEDRDNIDQVEKEGPFPCHRQNSWMGDGFYFWDTFIDLAHWWGEQGYKDKPYIICKSVVDFKEGELLDLEDPNTMLDFLYVSNTLIPKLYPKLKGKPTVKFVIDALKKRDEFRYKAVRLRGTDSVKYSRNILKKRLFFQNMNDAYLDLCPAIQICIFDKTLIGNENFKVVYPEKYTENWYI